MQTESAKAAESLSETYVKERLRHITDPFSGQPLPESGLLSGIVIKDKHIGVMLTIERGQQEQGKALQQQVEQALRQLGGIEKVTVVLTAESASAQAEDTRKKAVWNVTPIENVRKIIAVASGKGGVGKSTVTALIALSLAQAGKRVGIVDADIYGPSIPHMMGLAEVGKPALQGSKMLPFEAGGVQCMSVGFLLEAGQAAIMRGPMVSKTLHQLLRGTQWGEEGAPLDVLVMDMPPGTGDVHLSMVQQVPLAEAGGGAVIVTTPQEIALLDARKCVTMFAKTETPVLGVVENMSYVEHPDSKEKMRIFGEGGGRILAKEADAPLLAELAMQPALRAAADAGKLPQFAQMMGRLPFTQLF